VTRYGLDLRGYDAQPLDDASIDRQVDLLLGGFAVLVALAVVGAARVARLLVLAGARR
jgi:hypothetical protein